MADVTITIGQPVLVQACLEAAKRGSSVPRTLVGATRRGDACRRARHERQADTTRMAIVGAPHARHDGIYAGRPDRFR